MMVQPKMLSYESKSGKRFIARLLTVYDAAYLVDIFEHMSPESRYNRFLTPMDNPKPDQIWQEASRIVWMGDDQQEGLLALWQRPFLPDVPVGAARYVLMNDDTAEIAISVRDDMHGQGIGTWLLRETMYLANTNGVQRLVGTANNNNDAIWRVLDRMPFPYTRMNEGSTSEIDVDLTMKKTSEGF